MKRGVLLIIGVIFLALFGVLVFTLVRSGGKKTVTNPVLKVWAPFDEKKVYDEMAKPFLEANPGVTFEFKYVEATDAKDYEAKVVDAIASGTGPDIWLIRTDWLPKHATKLATMPKGLGWTGNKKETDEQALARLFSKAVVDQNSVDGAIYGLPLSLDSLVLYINDDLVGQIRQELAGANESRADLLQKDPKTWTDLENWVRLITRKDAKGNITQPAIALGTVENTYAAVDIYTALLQQYGGVAYTNPAEVGLHLAAKDGSVPAVKALDYFTSFGNPKSPNYTWNVGLGDPVQKFASEQLPLLIGYSSLRPQLMKMKAETTHFGIIPLPQLTEVTIPTDERTDFAAYWTHVVPKSSQNQALAWKFIERLITDTNQNYYSTTVLKPAFLNVSQNVSNEVAGKNFTDTTVFVRQAFNAGPFLKPEWQFVDATLQTMINSVEVGLLAPQAAVDTAAQKLKDGH